MTDIFERARHAPRAVSQAQRLQRTMNLPEKVLWKVLRKLDLHVRRQAPIGRYIADFVCHEIGLVIEIDGYPHTFAERRERDLIRDDWLRSQGYRVLRFGNQQVLDQLDVVMEAIHQALPLEGEGALYSETSECRR